ncbi:MAG: hypothetical protein FWF71_04035 [Actinomycetia bacterium]|nr:hypothetical protein [Actinomycetes bacterium]
MRIILLSGFLGSGKTTLLIQLIDYLSRQTFKDDSGGERAARIAIIENEIGSINLDSKMLSGKGFAMREMLSGCICCSLQDNLAIEITKITETIDPDWLVIEATGLASAREVTAGLKSAIDDRYYDGDIHSIVLVDASRLPMLLEKTKTMVSRQLERVDVLVLNKIDLVSDEEKSNCYERLREIKPDTRMVEMSAEKDVADDTWQQVVTDPKAG